MSCKGQKAEMIESVIVMEGVGRKQGEAEGGEGKKKPELKRLSQIWEWSDIWR